MPPTSTPAAGPKQPGCTCIHPLTYGDTGHGPLCALRTASTERPHGDWAAYDRAMAVLKDRVLALNTALGYDASSWDAPKITIGYIGNSGPGFDDRSWSVFLPHPNRIGTSRDQVGSWRTGDAEGIRAALSQVMAMLQITEHLTEQRLLAGWSTK